MKNVRLVAAVAPPNEPNIGRYNTGCGVGIEALASPITTMVLVASGFFCEGPGARE